ncbi:MAG: thioredoxin domain-containing protein, partial [Phycisphaerae bacterium]
MSTITAGRCVAIRWMAWGPEALARAAKEDKLILVDSGATWCHWCHVMDRMTYEDEEVAALVNERFIPVRIDRDKLAEIDARLQRSPAIVDSQAGGWPLTAVLTPDGHILFKATFLPPRAGGEFGASVGLIDLLNRLDAAWRANRDKIADAGRQLAAAYAAQEAQVFGRAGDVSPALLQRIVTAIKAQYDPSHGGFGAAPKFYNAPAVETLLAAAWSGDRSAMEMAAHTLEMIARGGVHDQVGGGFHRYSVDERWHVPHFEKMAYDNAGLLAIYANASALAGRDDFAAVARRTIAWIDRTLLDPQRRGFYASQDADVGLDDDGDYFTWTLAEVRQAAGADADAAIYYYDVTSDGDMHGRPGRNVLHATKTIAQAARLLNRNEDDLAAAIERARLRMLQARDARTAPVVDKTIFADLNGMMIDAYLTAHERLGDTAARDTAIAVLDNLLTDLRDDRGVFAHWRSEGGPQRVGMLSDQAWMAKALVHAFALTSQGRYLDAAVKVCDHVLANLIAPDGAPLSTWHGHLAREWHGHPAREWHGHLAREWHGHLA